MHTHSYELLPMIIVMQHLVHTSPGVLCRAKQLFRAVETVCATVPVWFPSEMHMRSKPNTKRENTFSHMQGDVHSCVSYDQAPCIQTNRNVLLSVDLKCSYCVVCSRSSTLAHLPGVSE